MYSKEALEVFLEKQGQLFDEPVADTIQEAAEFLDECMAVEVNSLKEVKAYMEEIGDIEGMSLKELEEACEVFKLSKGRYLIVEG